ncbi:MAG: hypothetical protein AAF231_05650 [Pseudomonadota bacterium]
MTLYICGNSHTRALRAGAIALEKEEGADPMVVFPLGTADNEAEPFSAIEDGKVVLTNRRFRKKLKQFFDVSTFEPEHRWGICLGNHNYRILRSDMWETAAPSWLGQTDKTPISEALFDRIVDEDQKHIRAFFDQLIETGVRPFVISAPWPVRPNPETTELKLPPETILAIDSRSRTLFADWLSDRGISLVTPPGGTDDADGFLKPKYAKGGEDPYHANDSYGRLMMRKVLAHEGKPATTSNPVPRRA